MTINSEQREGIQTKETVFGARQPRRGTVMVRKKRSVATKKAKPSVKSPVPRGYETVLSDLKQLIGDARRRAASTVNRELVQLYWQIGAVIVQQQAEAAWGEAVVVQLAADLRAAFPEIKGFSRDNVFRMRQFHRAWLDVDDWLHDEPQPVATESLAPDEGKVATLSRLFLNEGGGEIVATLSRHFQHPGLAESILNASWSHHKEIIALERPAERYFYLQLGIRERWSVRELRRQIDADLFTRYVSVREHPEKCLPAASESGELLPFKDHYVLEFLGLEDEHSEQQLRHAILANLRDFFLEFGRELTFVGEEYPLTVGNDTFSIDLLFFHRRLQCLIAVDLKKGKFKPEYVGKCQFYCAALDEQITLPHEKPSIGLVLCKSADRVQVRLALTAAAEQIGVATYQTALPDERLMKQRLRQINLNDGS